jgi:hypothetical protein
MDINKRGIAQHITDTVFLFVCSAVIVAMAIGIFLLPRPSFSEEENRALSPLPTFTTESLISGRFFTSLSSFYSDNIPLRKHLVRAKAVCELSLGKQQNNGVIFSPNGRLTDTCHYKSTELLKKNLDGLSDFCRNAPTNPLCVFVPRSIDVLRPDSEEQKVIRQAVETHIPLSTTLSETLYIDDYYGTDHHVTTEGAYKIYSHICQRLGISPFSEEHFQITPVSHGFLGSIYSRSGLLPTMRDTVSLPMLNSDLTVACRDTGCPLNSLYDMDKLNTKDKYTVFLGGNHGILTVISANEPKPSLLIIKDSFANALIPFLSEHFDITAVDPRYCMASIQQLMTEQDFDKILILCGIDTLATNGAFERILY